MYVISFENVWANVLTNEINYPTENPLKRYPNR